MGIIINNNSTSSSRGGGVWVVAGFFIFLILSTFAFAAVHSQHHDHQQQQQPQPRQRYSQSSEYASAAVQQQQESSPSSSDSYSRIGNDGARNGFKAAAGWRRKGFGGTDQNSNVFVKQTSNNLASGQKRKGFGGVDQNTEVPVQETGDASDEVDDDGDVLAPMFNANHPHKIKDTYLVVLKKDAYSSSSGGGGGSNSGNGVSINSLRSSPEPAIRALFRGSPRAHFDRTVRGYSTVMDKESLRTLRRNKNVEFIEAVTKVGITGAGSQATPPSWGLDRLDQRSSALDKLYEYQGTGEGVNVFVVDTGIRKDHQEFGGRAVHGFSSVGDDMGSDDCLGHGTHVSATIGGATYGVAKGAKLIAVRVLGCDGIGSTDTVIQGIEWMIKYHKSQSLPSIASLSLAGGTSVALDNAINSAINAGITFVVAAGNNNQDACDSSPARVPNAITVGSTTTSDVRSSFSNWGPCVDIFAPGSSIVSAWNTSPTSTAVLSGTSMATPHVTGIATLFLAANPTATPAQVAAAIFNAATPNIVTNPQGAQNRLAYSMFNMGGDGSSSSPSDPFKDFAQISGNLTSSMTQAYHPQSYYYTEGGVMQQGVLRGPEQGADFDLYLLFWNGKAWTTVASSLSAKASETITYNTPQAGYYIWKVVSYSGQGPYKFYLRK